MKTPMLYSSLVKGHLDLYWADWFDGLTITHQAPSWDGLKAGQVIRS